MKALDLFDRPIAFHRSFVVFGGVHAALLLSQAVYWSKRTDDGWFWKTAEEWKSETGLSWREQKTARSKLVSFGVLHEREDRLAHRMYYHADVCKIAEVLGISIENRSDSESGDYNPNEIPGSEKVRSGGPTKRDPLKEHRLSSETTKDPPHNPPQGGDGCVCDDRSSGFYEFINAYPESHRIGIETARRAWKRYVAGKVEPGVVLKSVMDHRRYDRRWGAGYIPNPVKFIREGRWKDQIRRSEEIEEDSRPVKVSLCKGGSEGSPCTRYATTAGYCLMHAAGIC